MNTCKTSNFLFIDIAKVVGIYLIIFGYIISASFLFNYIYSFHLALFFILAGFLYKQKAVKENLIKIFGGLLIPYLIYQFSYLPLRLANLVLFHDNSLIPTFLKMLMGIFIGNTRDTVFSTDVCEPCWFIMSIIIIRLLFANLHLCKNNMVVISLFAIIFFEIFRINHIILPFTLLSVCMAIPYFALGILFNNIRFIIFLQTLDINNKIFLSLCGFIFLAFIIKFNGLLNIAVPWEPRGMANLFLSYTSGILGTLSLVLISSIITKNNKFINTISKNTLFIIFFHWFLMFFLSWSGLIKYIKAEFDSHTHVVLLYAILSLAILVVNYFVILILQKYCPLILGKYRPKR
ncbi:MAG: hypothetical protein LUH05_06150 [Candidatus Gastranaerophilales bacterium]|nr:hypothetical protein [Candidatus Gastranaerophilales bacterium]